MYFNKYPCPREQLIPRPRVSTPVNHPLPRTLSPKKVSVSADLGSASETPQGKDRAREARESLAGEPQAYMLTRAEKAEKRALREHLALGLSQCLLGLCGLTHRPVARL